MADRAPAHLVAGRRSWCVGVTALAVATAAPTRSLDSRCQGARQCAAQQQSPLDYEPRQTKERGYSELLNPDLGGSQSLTLRQ